MPKHIKAENPLPENVLHVPFTITNTFCVSHFAPEGTPCWEIHTENGRGRKLPAICNRRAKNAGFNGHIQPASLGVGRTFGQPS